MSTTSYVTLSDIIARLDILTTAILSNKQTLSIEEAAIYTNLKVSYLYKLTSLQKIPHFKPRGKMIYFDRAELDEWLLKNRVNSTEDIDAKAAEYITAKKLQA
jgi:excisionase family DNA binding protein